MATKKSETEPEFTPKPALGLVTTTEDEGKIATALGDKWLASAERFTAAWEEHRIDTIELAQFLYSQKQRLPSLLEFGRFCTRHIPQINHNDRAALVYMGEHMAETREVLAKSKRRSPQHICAQEIKPLVEAKALALSSREENGDITTEETGAPTDEAPQTLEAEVEDRPTKPKKVWSTAEQINAMFPPLLSQAKTYFTHIKDRKTIRAKLTELVTRIYPDCVVTIQFPDNIPERSPLLEKELESRAKQAIAKAFHRQSFDEIDPAQGERLLREHMEHMRKAESK